MKHYRDNHESVNINKIMNHLIMHLNFMKAPNKNIFFKKLSKKSQSKIINHIFITLTNSQKVQLLVCAASCKRCQKVMIQYEDYHYNHDSCLFKQEQFSSLYDIIFSEGFSKVILDYSFSKCIIVNHLLEKIKQELKTNKIGS